jgi:hypothetical protein
MMFRILGLLELVRMRSSYTAFSFSGFAPELSALAEPVGWCGVRPPQLAA